MLTYFLFILPIGQVCIFQAVFLVNKYILQLLQDKFDELESNGVFGRPEDYGVMESYLLHKYISSYKGSSLKYEQG